MITKACFFLCGGNGLPYITEIKCDTNPYAGINGKVLLGFKHSYVEIALVLLCFSCLQPKVWEQSLTMTNTPCFRLFLCLIAIAMG